MLGNVNEMFVNDRGVSLFVFESSWGFISKIRKTQKLSFTSSFPPKEMSFFNGQFARMTI